jgi:hypothetical protein
MTTFTRGHALIIGVGTYQHSPRHDVPATTADAQAVSRVVQDAQFCGYPAAQVTLCSESSAARDSILAALDKLAQTDEDDTVLFFYSGHGDLDTNDNYTLTTHDTQWQDGRVVPGTAIGQDELLKRLRAVPAKRMLLLFNACHAGKMSHTLGDEAAPTGSALPNQTANALLSTGSGRIVITACRENQVAFVGSGELTLFAQMLTEGLRGSEEIFNRKGYISAFDLYTHLYYAVGEAVQSTIPQHIRDRHGNTQEPELTVLKGVGPFAVALYPGAQTLGDFPADHAPAEGTVVREVPEHRSQRALQNIIGTATVQGDNSGQNVGVNYGKMTQHTQNINNQAANQGAQGTFHGPVSFDHSRSTFDQRDQEVKGNQYNANRDLTHIGGDYVGGDKVGGDKVGGDKVGGDKIDAQGAQGFVNRPSGPVSQQFGDTVGGDKNTGDISVGNVSGSGIAIGHKAQAQSQQGGDADAFARAFSQVYQAINARPPDPDVDRDEMTRTVQNIQAEAQKGEQASEKKLSLSLNYLAEMASDIFNVTAAALTGPQAAAATVARKVAERIKQARGQG